MTEIIFEKFGGKHKRYLKQHHKVLYYNLLTSGKLNSYLADIEQQPQQFILRLVKELAEKENLTEKLYRTDFRSEREFRIAVKEYVEFYNEKRPHSVLRY